MEDLYLLNYLSCSYAHMQKAKLGQFFVTFYSLVIATYNLLRCPYLEIWWYSCLQRQTKYLPHAVGNYYE